MFKLPREFFFIAIFSLLIVFFSSLPFLFAQITTPSNMKFLGYFSGREDTLSYYTWIKQAADGQTLFKGMYSSEETRRVFFQPLFLLIGNFSRLTHLNLIFSYHFFRLFFAFLLLFAVYLFIRVFFRNPYDQIFAFLTTALGGGIISSKSFLINFAPEMHVFSSLYYSPLFSFSIFLMLIIFLLLFNFWKTGKSYFILSTAILCLILGFIHPYDLISILVITFIFLLTISLYRRDFSSKYFSGFFVLAISSIIPMLYYLLLSKNDILFKALTYTKTITPYPYELLIGYGLILPFAVFGALKSLRSENENLFFLFIWIIVSFSLIYAPFNFQRKLLMGLSIPLSIFAYLGFKEFINLFKPSLFTLLFCTFLLLISSSNLHLIIKDANKIVRTNSQSWNHYLSEITNEKYRTLNEPYVLPNEFMQAFAWLNKNAPKETVILCSPLCGSFIPAFTDNKVFIGHWDQTVNSQNKKAVVTAFFKDKLTRGKTINFLKKHQIQYIFYSSIEKTLYKNSILEWQKHSKPVFSNSEVVIYLAQNSF
jgi:hypothetical protein